MSNFYSFMSTFLFYWAIGIVICLVPLFALEAWFRWMAEGESGPEEDSRPLKPQNSVPGGITLRKLAVVPLLALCLFVLACGALVFSRDASAREIYSIAEDALKEFWNA